jgi:hypothetical protein
MVARDEGLVLSTSSPTPLRWPRQGFEALMDADETVVAGS